jgi:putative nucleotidyltransferase with HDIG domain
MIETGARLERYEDVIKRLAATIRGARLYSAGHPRVRETGVALLKAVRGLHLTDSTALIGIVGGELIGDDTPLLRATAQRQDLIQLFESLGISRITISNGITLDELIQFVGAVAGATAPPPARDEDDASIAFIELPHLTAGPIVIEPGGSWGSGTAAAATTRKVYVDSVTTAETVWESARVEGRPELPAARQAVEGLADAVTHHRPALLGLTAMQRCDNYTFTHMVNVSILTMAQARTLGIEGRLLRDLGLAGLMHDIGKVRTPSEILNKPEKLTEAEFEIMKRHTVDGALILRRTPDMPTLAPVVAFEHHMRLDGSGYPGHTPRQTLNLGTMLCAIADVYDAMRSQRTYQQSFPSDRILTVLQRNDGLQLDQRLVRRFVQLLGIYPPGTTVRLTSGEIALVLRVHAPDPFRPAVRVFVGASGEHLTPPVDRNLWESAAGTSAAIEAPLDPQTLDVDALALL